MYCVAWSQYRLKCRDLHVLFFWTADSSPTFTDPCRLYFSSTSCSSCSCSNIIPPFRLDLPDLPELLPNPSHLKRHSQHSHQPSRHHHQQSDAFWPPQVDLTLVWSMRHWYISSSSWERTSSTFACKGTAKSTNKSCHLLNYVAWIAGTSGPSTSTGAGVGIAGGQQLVVTADVHQPNVQKAGKQFI